MNPPDGGDLPVSRLCRRDGGEGHGRCPVAVAGGGPKDRLWVPAGRDEEEE